MISSIDSVSANLCKSSIRVSRETLRATPRNLFCVTCSLSRYERDAGAHTGAAYNNADRAHILYNNSLNQT